jgi:amino acid adenylation domain-containing protein
VDVQSQLEDNAQGLKGEWSDSLQGLPESAGIAELVEMRTKDFPDAKALVSGGQVLTYRELDRQSNCLANYLLRCDLGPERPLLICLPRSLALAVSALAALKAGVPYLPVDPEWPLDRLAFVLKDSGASGVITQDGAASNVPRGRWRIVNLDVYTAEISRCSTSLHIDARDPERLAYIIYTSGSTGEPKGVEITHRGLLNLVNWHLRAFRVRTVDRATLLASPGFDASVWEIWPYLCAGASLYVPEDSVRNDPESLRDWLVSQKITITFASTPLAERMIELAWPAHTALRVMLTGADALHRYPPAALPFDLINNYGPTECTVVATSGTVPKGAYGVPPPPIGRPIANTQVLVLDHQLQPVPIGATGELYVSGSGVARGYLNRPALTAEKFIANPFSPTPNSRLYRTGDLARQSPDGQILYVGRSDDQVKVRGFRIEPGEVMARLNRHPAIQASYVTVCEDGKTERDLVAYIALIAQSDLTDEQLRTFLREHLPEYMIPSVFVSLGALPLNTSGKVDRQSLPAPGRSNILRSGAPASAEPALEARVTEIVSDLLGLQHVNATDNFFMLGGNSLLGAQVIARTADAFGVEISLRTLFEGPTVAHLSVEIERLLTEQVGGLSEEEVQQQLDSLES